jgi:aspartyl-tRNA synthetase
MSTGITANWCCRSARSRRRDQIVFDATNAPVHDMKSLRSEFVIEVSGRVRVRAEGL